MRVDGLSALGRRTEEPAISWLMKSALVRPQLISLAAGFTDHPSLPTAEVDQLVHAMMQDPAEGQGSLQYGTTAGDPLLRKLTGKRILSLDRTALRLRRDRPADPALYSPDRLIISHGSQQMLYMLIEALCDPGDIVLVEDPTYFVFLGILQSHGVEARGVKIDRDGLNPEHLDQVLHGLKREGKLKQVKMLYLVSYHQNPTGATTAWKKKSEALQLLRRFERAAGHPIYLLEDAAYRELRFEGADTPSALALPGAASRVIYSGTYSKPFATGARVGFGLLPEPIHTAIMRIKGNHDFGTANFLQQLLARALKGGAYERHVLALRIRYAHKAEVMRKAISEFFPDAVECWEPHGGLYFWAKLPARLKSGPRSRLFQQALKRDVLYVPGLLCYAPDPGRYRPDHEMRISFGAAPEVRIREGIRRLGGAIQAML